MLKHWNLLEPMPHQPDNKKRSGFWRVTPAGLRFVRDADVVMSHAIVFNDELQHYEGEFVSIRDTLAEKFDYEELMSEWSQIPMRI